MAETNSYKKTKVLLYTPITKSGIEEYISIIDLELMLINSKINEIKSTKPFVIPLDIQKLRVKSYESAIKKFNDRRKLLQSKLDGKSDKELIKLKKVSDKKDKLMVGFDETDKESKSKKAIINTDTDTIEDTKKIQEEVHEYISVTHGTPVADEILASMNTESKNENNSGELAELKKISNTNLLISQELKKIREDMIDEQDTTVEQNKKVSDTVVVPNTFSQGETVNKDGGLLSGLGLGVAGGMLGGLVGTLTKILPNLMKGVLLGSAFAGGLWIGEQINKFFGWPTLEESLIKYGGLQGLLTASFEGLLITTGIQKLLDTTSQLKKDGLESLLPGYTDNRLAAARETTEKFKNQDLTKSNIQDNFIESLEDANVISVPNMLTKYAGGKARIINFSAIKTLTPKQYDILLEKYDWVSSDKLRLQNRKKWAQNKLNNQKISEAPNPESEITKPISSGTSIIKQTPTVSKTTPSASQQFKSVFNTNNENVKDLDPAVQNNLLGLGNEYNEMFGEKLFISSGYRSLEEQAKLHRDDPNKAAAPGRSMHNYGFAIDLPTPQLNKANEAGLLDKYNFDRPAHTKDGKLETWHIEPKGLNYEKIRNQAKVNTSIFKDNPPEAEIPKEAAIASNKTPQEIYVNNNTTNLVNSTKNYDNRSVNNISQGQPNMMMPMVINNSETNIDNTSILSTFQDLG